MTVKQMWRRNFKIVKMYQEGLTIREVAEEVLLSKTRVHEIVAYNK
jgi:DNA-binding NarL/FixJ family response regulator